MTRPSWTTIAPVLAIVALVPAWFAKPENALVLGLLAVIIGLQLLIDLALYARAG